MKKMSFYPDPLLNYVKWVNHLSLTFKVCAVVFLSLISANSFAQTFPPASSCTSGDLELISATLPAPAGDRCNCTGTRTLVLGIRNKTGSTRTSFALWGTLHRYNSSGVEIGTGTSIFACAGPIVKNSDNFLPATSGTTTIAINCGESLTISDLYLAWTSANNNETCDVLAASPSTINPKCGTLPLINVGIGVNGTTQNTAATCTAGGKIRITPSGGLPGYEVALDGSATYNTVPANPGYYEFTNVAAGAHTVTIRDNISRPVAERCSVIKNTTVVSPAAVTAEAGPNLTITCSSNPNGGTIGEASSSDFTYSWAPTDGLSSTTSSNPTANPSSTTTYTVTKTNIATGCSATDNVTVAVNKTAPIADAGSNVTVTCTTPGALLTATGGVSYLWSTAETTASINVSPSSTTTYNVTVTGSNGCKAVDNVTVVANNAAPNADAGSNVTVTCTTPGATLTATGGVSYLWSTGQTTASINVTPSSTTTYNVTVTGSNGCTASDNVTVTANKTVPTADAGSNVTVTCTTPGATLTATGGVSYLWSTAQTTASINVSPSSTTTYNVTVTGSNGCTASDNVTVTVDKTIPSADAGSNVTVTCTTPGATLTATGGVSYLWSTAQTTASINVSPSSTTTYNVTVTGSNGCTASDNVTVTVNKTAPSFTVCLVQPDLCNQYGSVTVNASGTGLTYKLNGGSPTSNNVFSSLASGSVTSITVIGANGCPTTVQCADLVQNCSTATGRATSGTATIESAAAETTVKAYPNPFSDRIKFVVTSPVAGNGVLEVYNMMGQKVKTVYNGYIAAGTQTFELSLQTQQVANMVYVLRMGDKKMTGKILQINK